MSYFDERERRKEASRKAWRTRKAAGWQPKPQYPGLMRLLHDATKKADADLETAKTALRVIAAGGHRETGEVTASAETLRRIASAALAELAELAKDKEPK